MTNPQTEEQKIEEIIDEYASMVDDDNTYFVKPEVKKKYIDQIMNLLSSVRAEERQSIIKQIENVQNWERQLNEVQGKLSGDSSKRKI